MRRVNGATIRGLADARRVNVMPFRMTSGVRRRGSATNVGGTRRTDFARAHATVSLLSAFPVPAGQGLRGQNAATYAQDFKVMLLNANGGRCRVRTCDPSRVKGVLYR